MTDEKYHLAARLIQWIMALGFICTPLAAPAAADGKRLMTEKEFRELIVDRQLTRDRTVLSYTGDNRIAGSVRDERIEGMWSWADTHLCRMAIVGSRNLSYDCQAIFVIYDLVVLVRDKGQGEAFALRFHSEDSQPGDTTEMLACFC